MPAGKPILRWLPPPRYFSQRGFRFWAASGPGSRRRPRRRRKDTLPIKPPPVPTGVIPLPQGPPPTGPQAPVPSPAQPLPRAGSTARASPATQQCQRLCSGKR